MLYTGTHPRYPPPPPGHPLFCLFGSIASGGLLPRFLPPGTTTASCPSMAGMYPDEGAILTVWGPLATGKFTNSRPYFTGTITADCSGSMYFPDDTSDTWAFNASTLSWSNGGHWTWKGIPENSERFERGARFPITGALLLCGTRGEGGGVQGPVKEQQPDGMSHRGGPRPLLRTPE